MVPHSIAVHFIMFTGACTKDGDCKKTTIETGNDNCASLPHYPQEEPLGNSIEFSKENAATEEICEDETQLGNGQDNFERFSICKECIISQWLYQGCSHRVLWLESVSQKKGTERRDDSGSRRKYATESSRQEKMTRPHHHGTSSVYLSPDFSSDLLNRNATGTAILGNNMRENPVDITNITTPCQVNKNCNCCN